MYKVLIPNEMTRFELTLPAMGEGIIEATITKWLVSAGQQVESDQPLLEVATDKVDSEIPSPVSGKIVKLVYHEGEIPKVGEVIALIETSQVVQGDAPIHEDKDRIIRTPVIAHEPAKEVTALQTDQRKTSGNIRTGDIGISPLIRSLARQRGINSAELKRIKGTGLNGRLIKEDILAYLLERIPANSTNKEVDEFAGLIRQKEQAVQLPQVNPGDEVVEMDRLRKLIAGNMLRSKQIAAHVTSFLEADVTALAAWRETHKEAFYHREQARLTYTPMLIEIAARTLKEFPRINVSVSGDSVIVHKNINIGFATALPDGNLIVPVIRDADHENLGGLARKVADLAERARNNLLLPAEIRGGTFTITNIGQYNNLTGTPIINQPEAAILAVGTILKKPWAVKSGEGYGIAVRDITMLSLTYDHRVIDGALGGTFLSRIAWYLENFEAYSALHPPDGK
jgi:2-oxoglutarate dehydrogenase E2 component (dihydrolipoamide succinyltransferase)